ncbi:hypothetical protein [Streptacidiphilus sp. MAP12-16]|uniref:hypothetical protein n=1 Tax=Streptacidiphilus sp. MAP12-16 TaxID=3156300 RepID=UPI0035161A99
MSPQVAPADFNPLTASNAELARYGFPRHPKHNDQAWKAAMKAAKHRTTDTTTWTCAGITHGKMIPGPKLKTGIVSPAWSLGPGNPVTSSNWAGNQVPQATDEATWEWIVPGGHAKQPNTCYSMVSPWVGIGNGVSGDPLVQAGSEDHYDCNGYNVHYMWHQVYPEGSVAFVHPYSFGIGDDIYVDVWVSGYTAYYFMEDKTKGQYTTYSENYSGNVSRSAEWIIEKGGNGLSAWNGAMSTYNAYWQYTGGSLDPAGAWPHNSYHLYYNGQDVAHGGAWTDPGTYSAFPLYSSGT